MFTERSEVTEPRGRVGDLDLLLAANVLTHHIFLDKIAQKRKELGPNWQYQWKP